MSAIEALNSLAAKYRKAGKIVRLQYLSNDCIQLLKNAEAIIEIDTIKDPAYRVVTDKR